MSIIQVYACGKCGSTLEPLELHSGTLTGKCWKCGEQIVCETNIICDYPECSELATIRNVKEGWFDAPPTVRYLCTKHHEIINKRAELKEVADEQLVADERPGCMILFVATLEVLIFICVSINAVSPGFLKAKEGIWLFLIALFISFVFYIYFTTILERLGDRKGCLWFVVMPLLAFVIGVFEYSYLTLHYGELLKLCSKKWCCFPVETLLAGIQSSALILVILYIVRLCRRSKAVLSRN